MSYTQDCSTRALLKIAQHEGYKFVDKGLLDKYVQALNQHYSFDDINAQASVDIVLAVCDAFGWRVDIVSRVVDGNGKVAIQVHSSTPRVINWRPKSVISLVYDVRYNSGHYEACRSDIVNEANHPKIIAQGFAWAYL